MDEQPVIIFYTDDDEDDREMFADAVGELNESFVVVTHNDGDSLLKSLLHPPPVPHVIFLDLNMPRKNGFKVLQEIRNNEKIKDLKIVMWTSSDDESHRELSYSYGADYFITKPSSYNELKKLLVEVLHFDTGNNN